MISSISCEDNSRTNLHEPIEELLSENYGTLVNEPSPEVVTLGFGLNLGVTHY